jgi:PAS domain S-box-containing protein
MEDFETKLKTLQDELRQVKEQNLLYRKIIDDFPVGVQVFNKKGLSIIMNKKQAELLGLPDNKVGIGKFNILTDPFSKANGIVDTYSKVYAGESQDHIVEYNWGQRENKWETRKDVRILQEKLLPIRFNNHEVDFVLSFLDDITEKTKTQKLLEDKIKQHEDFINHSPDILYKFSNKQGAMFWSDRVTDVLGFGTDDLLEKPFLWVDSIHPDDRPMVDDAIVNMDKGEFYTIEYRIKRKDGQWIWLKEVFMFKSVIDGEIIIEGHATDITSQKHIELELEDAKMRFDYAMQATNDGLYDWNLLTNEIYYSPNWKKMVGYAEDELPNDFSVWEQLTHPEDVKKSWEMLNEHLLGKRQSFDMEFRMKHKQGHWVDILSRARALFNEQGKAYRVIGTHVDITERKKIKQKLEDSELRWKLVIEGSKDGLWDWNVLDNTVFFSKQWKTMLGYKEEEIGNGLEEWDKRVHPDDKEQTYTDLNNCLKGETEVYINEHRMLCKDGAYIWILDRGIVLERDDRGEPIRMVGTHSDITERKKAEKALKESEEKYRSFVENFSGIAYKAGSDYIPEFMHGACEQITGYAEGEFLAGKPLWTEVVAPEYLDYFYKQADKLLDKTESSLLREYEIIKKDGSRSWISEVMHNYCSVSGDFKYVHGIILDITEKKKIEQDVLASQVKFKTIFDTIDVGIIITNEKGQIIDCNAASEKMQGLNLKEHQNRNIKRKVWKTIRPDYSIMPNEEYAGVRALRENRVVKDIEVGLQSDEGIRWVSSSASPINLPGYGVLIAYVDITQVKAHELELKELVHTKDKFFSILAHDLRSPFSSILGFSELAQKYLNKKDYGKLFEICSCIYDSTNSVFNLLNNLLDWSRVQTGRIKFNPEQINIKSCMEEAVSELLANSKDKQIDLVLNVDKELEFSVDRFMLKTILRNLISNAIKYTYPGGGIVVAAEKVDGYVQISIQDFGIGMDEDILDNLFKIESNISVPGTNRENGTGLGLILCKEFVEKHHGEIFVESEPGKGSTFTFSLK